MDARRQAQRGFTLAELIVASTLISLVMASVYTAFNSTLRVRRMGEQNLHTYQDARTALTILAKELNCLVQGSEHLFEGEDDRFEFFAVASPMDVETGKGARVLWIQYRYSRSLKTLFREEALVKDALPLRKLEGEERIDRQRIKLGRKRKYEFVTDVLAFDVSYWWMPAGEPQPAGEPPAPIEPVVLEENRQRWGLPQGVRVSLTLEDVNAESGRTTFDTAVSFRGPTMPYEIMTARARAEERRR